MCIDEKQKGEDFFTILSNRQTGKIAFMANTTKSSELLEASFPIRKELQEIKVINRDLASCYRCFCDESMPNAEQVSDKFHIIKLLLDACQSVRIGLKQKNNTLKREAYEVFKDREKKRKEECQKMGKSIKNKNSSIKKRYY